MPVVVRPLDDVPDRARVNEQQLAAVEARGEVFVSAGAGTGKTSVLVERFVRAVCDEGLDVESVLVITYTRKAAGELRSRIRARAARARARRPRAQPRRRVDLDDPRLLLAAAARASVRGRHRPALPRARRRARRRAARRGVRARARRVLRGRATSERLRLLATYGATGLRRMLTSVYETLRSAGPRARARAGRARRRRRAARGAAGRRRARSPPTPAPPTRRPPPRTAALALGGNPEQLLDLSHLAARGERAAEFRAARDRLRAGRARRARGARQRAAAGAARPVRRRVRARRSSASRRSTSRICSSTRASCCATSDEVREREQLRFRSIMVDEFQDTNRLQTRDRRPARAGSRRGRGVLRRRRVPVDLRLPSRRRRGVPRASRAVGAAAAADAQLPLAPGGARRGQPSLRRRVRRRATSRSPRRASSPTRCSAIPSSCSSPTRRATSETGEKLARRRGARDRAPRARARRRRRRGAGRDRAAVRRRHRRRSGTSDALRARRPADVPRDRPRVLRPAAGRRPARVPAPAAQPLRRRGARAPCSRRRSSACRTTGSC